MKLTWWHSYLVFESTVFRDDTVSKGLYPYKTLLANIESNALFRMVYLSFQFTVPVYCVSLASRYQISKPAYFVHIGSIFDTVSAKD